MINKNWKLYEQLSLLFLERKQVVVLDVYVWGMEFVEVKIVNVDVEQGK